MAAQRITAKDLEELIEQINYHRLGVNAPASGQFWDAENQRSESIPGALYLDFYNGGYDLRQYKDDRFNFEIAYFYRRVSGRELFGYLNGLLNALDVELAAQRAKDRVAARSAAETAA